MNKQQPPVLIWVLLLILIYGTVTINWRIIKIEEYIGMNRVMEPRHGIFQEQEIK